MHHVIDPDHRHPPAAPDAIVVVVCPILIKKEVNHHGIPHKMGWRIVADVIPRLMAAPIRSAWWMMRGAEWDASRHRLSTVLPATRSNGTGADCWWGGGQCYDEGWWLMLIGSRDIGGRRPWRRLILRFCYGWGGTVCILA